MADKKEPGAILRVKPKQKAKPRAPFNPVNALPLAPEGLFPAKPPAQKPKAKPKVRQDWAKGLELGGPRKPTPGEILRAEPKRRREPLSEQEAYDRDVQAYWMSVADDGSAISNPGYRGLADRTFDAMDRAGVDSQPFRTADEWLVGIGPAERAAARLGDAYRGTGEFSGWDAADVALSLPFAGPVDRLLAKPAKAAARAAPQAVKQPLRRAANWLGKTDPLVDRPAYSRAKEGPFTVVRRSDLQPEANPDILAARSLGDMRPMLRDPAANPALRAANEEALRVRGAPLSPGDPLPQTSLARQGAMGRAFEEAASGNPAYQHAVFERYGEMFPQIVEGARAQNYDQLREAAYRQLGDEVAQQFDRLPVALRYHDGPGEYGTPSEMLRDAIGRGQLNVFSGGEPHEFLSRVDPATGLSQNEMFRAVHDYIGHGATGSTFRPGGEEIAYATHQRTLSPLAQLALLAETRGQNSWVNYSPANADLIAKMNDVRAQMFERGIADDLVAKRYDSKSNELDLQHWLRNGLQDALDLPSKRELGAQLRELGSRFEYAPQKAVLMPPEYLDPMSPGGTPDWLRGIYQPEGVDTRGVHISHQEGLQATDPAFYGTGHRGVEYASTKGNAPDRTYFYTGDPGTIIPEPWVMGTGYGGDTPRSPRFAYETQLSGLYDINADPGGLRALAEAYSLPTRKSTLPEILQYDQSGRVERRWPQIGGTSALRDMERLVRDYGYKGYIAGTGNQRAAAVYDPVENLRAIARGEQGFAVGGRVKAQTSCSCS